MRIVKRERERESNSLFSQAEPRKKEKESRKRRHFDRTTIEDFNETSSKSNNSGREDHRRGFQGRRSLLHCSLSTRCLKCRKARMNAIFFVRARLRIPIHDCPCALHVSNESMHIVIFFLTTFSPSVILNSFVRDMSWPYCIPLYVGEYLLLDIIVSDASYA